MDHGILTAYVMLALLAGGLLYANIRHWKTRATLPPEDRAKIDSELRNSGDW